MPTVHKILTLFISLVLCVLLGAYLKHHQLERQSALVQLQLTDLEEMCTDFDSMDRFLELVDLAFTDTQEHDSFLHAYKEICDKLPVCERPGVVCL